VVLDGGEYHRDSSGHYWWDTVLVHDPEHFTGDWPISAGLWTDRRAGNFVPFDPSYGTLQQVVSAGAVAYWSYYLAQYGESMGIWDTGCELCIQYPE